MKLRFETIDGGGEPRSPLAQVVRGELTGEVPPGVHSRSRARLLAELATADARFPREVRVGPRWQESRGMSRWPLPRVAWPLLAAAALAVAFASGFLFGSRERGGLLAGPEPGSTTAPRPGVSLVPAPASAGPSASALASAAAEQSRSGRPSSGAGGPSLRELLERGEAGLVLERVESQGIDSCLRSCSAADLEALADAARYRGRSDLAERALQAQRQRFPRTELASTAAFLLGRAAEGRGDAGAAARYYRSYLKESPRGPLALEALGRAMLLARAAGDHEQARAYAREVLGRGGSGVYATQAREILSAP